MNAQVLGTELATWRREAGLTQAQLAARMGARQPVISRVETGRALPTLPFIERFARSCGRSEITLRFDGPNRQPDPDQLRERIRRVLGDFVFNPWERNPSAEEARTLNADGLTRERFESQRAASTGKARIIGLDDLYLDRLRQATIDERREGVEFHSALAVVAARYEEIDWDYVWRRLNDIRVKEGPIADTMKRIDSRVRRRVRSVL